MTESFLYNPVIQKLADNRKWTVSDCDKMPVDMTELIRTGMQKIRGASTEDGYCPFVTLPELLYHLPNAKNCAYMLDAATDGFIVLDIEPKCPREIAEELLKLPALYGEFSMSGKGFHLVFPLPETYTEVFERKTAVKEKHGYYEFLFNHYITFTGNVIPAGYTDNIASGTHEDFMKLWTDMVKDVDTTVKTVSDFGSLAQDEEKKTDWSDYVQEILQSEKKAYKKEPADFGDDMSVWEYGYIGHIFNVLKYLLLNLKIRDNYTKEAIIWEVFRAAECLIPFREKHNTMRNNMPLLLYESCKIVEQSYDEYMKFDSIEDYRKALFGEEETKEEQAEETDSPQEADTGNKDAKKENDIMEIPKGYEENADSYNVV